MIAYFTAAPVSTSEVAEGFRRAVFRGNGTDEEGHLRDFFRICGAGAMDDHQASGPGQICLQRLKGINVYCALVETSVFDVGHFGVGKKGAPASAVLWAL